VAAEEDDDEPIDIDAENEAEATGATTNIFSGGNYVAVNIDQD